MSMIYTYAGRFKPYLEAWHLIDRLIVAGINHWQPPLLDSNSNSLL